MQLLQRMKIRVGVKDDEDEGDPSVQGDLPLEVAHQKSCTATSTPFVTLLCLLASTKAVTMTTTVRRWRTVRCSMFRADERTFGLGVY